MIFQVLYILTQSSELSSPFSACNFSHDDTIPATSVITYLWWKAEAWLSGRWENAAGLNGFASNLYTLPMCVHVQ